MACDGSKITLLFLQWHAAGVKQSVVSVVVIVMDTETARSRVQGINASGM